jgi:hypothetical protein
MVLESRRGDPAPPDGDAGAVSTDQDAGPPKGVDPEMLRSGSRIRVRGVVSDGELLQVVGLHDALHDVDCSIQTADDGVSRCLPISNARVDVFSDANCTRPLMSAEPGGPPCWAAASPPAYAYWQSPNSCPTSGTHLVTPGEQTQPPAQVYDTASGTGQCEPTTSTATTSSTAGTPTFYVANPSPASDWVAFQKTIKPLTSQLGLIQWIGSDGSRFIGDTVLLSNGEPCGPANPYPVPVLGGVNALHSGAPGALSRCIPKNTLAFYVGSYFSDAACATPVVIAPACQAPSLLAVVSASNDPCSYGNDVSYFNVGDIVPNSSLYAPLEVTSGPEPCTSATGQLEGMVAYTKGAPVDPTTYPAMQLVLAGSGRVRHEEWQSEGVSISDAGHWTDAATGQFVEAAAFPGGVRRGVFSTSLEPDKFFSDAACKNRLVVGTSSSDVCGPSEELPRWVALPVPPATCDAGPSYESSVRLVGAKYTGKVYTSNSGLNVENNGGCSEYVPSKNVMTYEFYTLGDPVPASSVFAEIATVDL